METSEFQLCEGAVVNQRYQLDVPLGSGSQGCVWRAHDLQTHQVVAIKFLAQTSETIAKPADSDREVEALLRLRHPNINRMEAFNLECSMPYLITELATGAPLHIFLGRRTRMRRFLSLKTVMDIFTPIARALQHSHEQGIVHRDLKPHNIMIDARVTPARVKVLDFGVALVLDRDSDCATTLGRIFGSPFYMSPEQSLGQPVDASSDLFALATLLFEMLTLHRAWAQDEGEQLVPAFVDPVPTDPNTTIKVHERITKGSRPNPATIRPDIPHALVKLILQAWNPDPLKRPGSAVQMVEILQEAINAHPHSNQEPNMAEPHSPEEEAQDRQRMPSGLIDAPPITYVTHVPKAPFHLPSAIFARPVLETPEQKSSPAVGLRSTTESHRPASITLLEKTTSGLRPNMQFQVRSTALTDPGMGDIESSPSPSPVRRGHYPGLILFMAALSTLSTAIVTWWILNH